MLTDKYKPQTLENIIGNKSTIQNIVKWLENWNTTKTDSKNICALLSGINGIGKTLTVELLIQKLDLNPIQLSPDENADKEYITKTIIPSIKRSKSFTGKQNIFVIHDIDCYDDYGFISSIVTCLKETKIPVIATCNNRYDQNLKPILIYCLDMKFQKPSSNDINKFLKPFLKKENIVITDAKLNQLIEDSNNDIRSILNNLHFYNNTTSKDKTINNIFEVTKLFMSQNIELQDKQILFWMNHDILPLMIHENYPMNTIKMKNETAYLHNIASSVDSLSDIDILDKNIHINGNWELLPYVAFNSIKAVSNCHTKALINFTSYFQKNTFKRKKTIKNNMEDININPNKNKEKIVKPKVVKQPKEPKQPKQPKEPKITKKKALHILTDNVNIHIDNIIEETTAPNSKPKPKVVRRKKVNLIIEEE